MQLDEAKATDLAVTDEHVRQAEAEAAEAAELAAVLERRAVEDPEPPGPAEVVEQQALSRFAALRVAHTRKRADRAHAARRLLALGELAKEIDQLADEAAKPDDVLAQAARKVALASTTFRELRAQHDARVQALVDRANALDVEEPAPLGPRSTSAFVSLVKGAYGRPDGVQHGRRQVLILGDRVEDAIARAASGDANAAVSLVRAFYQQPEPPRADRYYRAPSGIVAESGPESAEMARQVRAGEIVPLTEAEVKLYLEGKLDGTGND